MIDLGTRLELFVEDFLVDSQEGTSLKLQAPVFAGEALAFDKPWEGCFVGYPTVIQTDEGVHLYYRGHPMVGDSTDQVTCYAFSEDGVHFERPELGLYEIEGDRANNVIRVRQEEGAHNFTPFLDTKPGVPADERFKALGSIPVDGKSPLAAFVSADGIRWRRMQEEPVITKGAFDSQNVAFWSESEGCYLCYYRTWAGANDPTEFKGVRTISRVASDDFLHWGEMEWMDYGPTPPEELYTNATKPYFRAPHIYLAFPKRFNPSRTTLSDAEVEKYGIVPQYAVEVSDGVFMSSRGGNRYHRTFMEAFVRPGRDRANWVSRTNMAAYGLAQTATDEISIYYQHRYAQPGHYLARYTVRLDGFASLNSPYAGGEMITKPLCFTGNRLVLNYATSGAGSIRVEIQDEHGVALPGFPLEDGLELFGDEIERVYSWESGTDLSALAGTPVRLRFAMKDADLFSLRFAG
ncbi:MAG: hypothetical protein KAI66_04425 [Lentisphaeria bacterium]|nr:hypothetical protein [Lentisphaeria bacterium]